MKLNEVFPSNYVKADDLKGREVPVVISEVKMEKLGTDTKLVLYFQHKDKGMVCNKTNAGRISYIYGDDTDDWIGKEIVLFAEFVEFQGKTVKGLRVKPPVARQAAPVQRTGYSVSTGPRPMDGLEEILPDATDNMEREPF